MKLLLIEDDPIWTDALPHYLTSVEVVVAERLKDGLEALQDNHFDLILLDVRLPDVADSMDGYRRIREVNQDTPIVAFSGTDSEDLARALGSEGTHFIRKDIIATAPAGLRTLLDASVQSFHGMKKVEQALKDAR